MKLKPIPACEVRYRSPYIIRCSICGTAIEGDNKENVAAHATACNFRLVKGNVYCHACLGDLLEEKKSECKGES